MVYWKCIEEVGVGLRLDSEIIMMDAYVFNAKFRPVLLALAPGLVNGIKASLRSQGIAVKVVTPNLQVELDANKQANDEARLRAHDKNTERRVIPRYGYYRLSNPWKCLLEMARGKDWRKWAKHIMADPNWRTYICSGIPKSWKGIPLQPNYFFNTTEIDEWMEEVGRSSRIAKVCSIGYSYEGRDTPIVKINHGRRRLPVVWIDAGVHAREWLSVSTALYLIHRILFGKDRDAMYLRNNFRWYIVPNANPDGYDFTWKDDRMWRKTRAPVTEQCIGTDINRNFDFHWGQFGASMNPCSSIYRGNGPFSEVETRNLRDAIWSIRRDAKLLLNLHTYDQTWLLPYLGLDETPPDYDELVRFLSCTHWMRCRWLGKTT
ncbi:Carboxypeptidase B [Lamellibrachia satsuma]|nr:Carboxypeptidase B [Lamellibrachia satsuma]